MHSYMGKVVVQLSYSVNRRYAQVLIKLVPPQAAQLGIHFLRKNSNDAPTRGTCVRTHY